MGCGDSSWISKGGLSTGLGLLEGGGGFILINN